MKKFKHYGELAAHLFNEMGLKIETVYVQDGNYSDYAVYLTRIGVCSRPKFRVLYKGEDRVKNCLKITYDPNRWEKKQIIDLVNKNMRLLQHHSVGSYQSFLRQTEVKQILSGILGPNGLPTPEAKAMLHSN